MAWTQQLQASEGGGGGLASSSLFFDPWLTAQGEPLLGLTEQIAERIERDLPYSARKPRQDARRRRRQCVSGLLANMTLLCLGPHLEPGSRLAVSTAKTKPTRYDRREFPQNLLAPSLVAMEEQGLIVRHPYVFKQRHTTLEPTAAFLEALEHNGVSLADVGREAGGEAIWLRARTGEECFGREPPPKVLVLYDDTEETMRFRREVRRVAAFLSRSDIRYAGRPQAPPPLRRMFLLRSPQEPHGFTLNGRLAGGFWMDLDARKRHLITIGSEPIVDLDYSAMFARLAYLRIGARLPEGDPYEVPGLEGHRAGAKRSLLSLLSRSSDMRRLAPELKALLPEGWTASRLAEAMTARHPAIAHLFGSDIGIDLMFQESTILMDLLLRLELRGVPALPFHDGIAVPESMKAAAMEAMAEASKKVLQMALPVKEKPIWSPKRLR